MIGLLAKLELAYVISELLELGWEENWLRVVG